ncbi:MAG: hypothetical protein R3324_14210 [Halobacteriales archaeon]|nr:hypothetical protein [Halobacteriales archaeon]
MNSEPLRIIVHSVSFAIGVTLFFLLLFGVGSLEQADPLAAAGVAVAVSGIFSGAGEVARRKVTPEVRAREREADARHEALTSVVEIDRDSNASVPEI